MQVPKQMLQNSCVDALAPKLSGDASIRLPSASWVYCAVEHKRHSVRVRPQSLDLSIQSSSFSFVSSSKGLQPKSDGLHPSLIAMGRVRLCSVDFKGFEAGFRMKTLTQDHFLVQRRSESTERRRWRWDEFILIASRFLRRRDLSH